MSAKILIIAAHPDDEVLGCGGTIAKYARAGAEVHAAILAEGVTSRDDRRDPDRHGAELSVLAQAARHASQILGAVSSSLHRFPDNRMDGVDRLEVVKVVEGLIRQHQPEIIFTHHGGDLNIDHRCTHEAVVTACRPLPSSRVKELLFFEVASSTEWQPPGSGAPFLPNWFVDITDTLELKLKALKAYQSEMREWPHPRSLEALEHLARWRGAAAGVAAAEAFLLGRKIIKKTDEHPL